MGIASLHTPVSSNVCMRSPCMPRAMPSAAHPAQHRRSNTVFRVNASGTTAEVEPSFTGAPVEVPPTPFVDANEQTILTPAGSNRIGLGNFTRNDGAPPRFMCPLILGGRPLAERSSLPYLLYLPGIDGTGLAAYKQFPGLAEAFDLVAFSVPPHDRTKFPRLVEIVEQFLEAEVKDFPPERPVYLLGESFGGILAIAVAAARPEVNRVILVNPATSYERSLWPVLGPLLPQVPKEMYEAVPIALAPVLGNPLSLASAGVNRSAPLQEQAGAFAQGLTNLIPQLSALTNILPPQTLAWKLRLLAAGCKFVENKYGEVQQRVLLLIGDGDWLIPSSAEGERLEKMLPRCSLKVLRGRSHALLQEAGVDLVQILREEGFYVQRRTMSAPVCSRSREAFGAAKPIELPTRIELDKLADKTLGWLRRLTSPVYFTRDASGNVQQGICGIPSDRPLLFVGNHQTYALDIGFLVEGLLREAGVMPRGLAHPVIFEGGGNSAFGSFMQTFGAVKVGPTSFFRLMKNKEAVLLYPGGVREAYKNKGEKYQLMWPEEPEFVRVAARFGATIIPVGAVGVEDSVEMLLDAPEIRQLPLIGEEIARRASQIPQARRGVKDNGSKELFLQPFSLPKPPERFYFSFGAPIKLRKEDIDDTARVAQLYRQTKQAVEGEIAFLLRQREQDPYRMLGPRLLYETFNRRQAPTFPLPAAPAAANVQLASAVMAPHGRV